MGTRRSAASAKSEKQEIVKNHQQVAKCGFDMSEPQQDRKFV